MDLFFQVDREVLIEVFYDLSPVTGAHIQMYKKTICLPRHTDEVQSRVNVPAREASAENDDGENTNSMDVSVSLG